LSTPQKLRLAQRHLGQVDPRFTPIIARAGDCALRRLRYRTVASWYLWRVADQ